MGGVYLVRLGGLERPPRGHDRVVACWPCEVGYYGSLFPLFEVQLWGRIFPLARNAALLSLSWVRIILKQYLLRLQQYSTRLQGCLLSLKTCSSITNALCVGLDCFEHMMLTRSFFMSAKKYFTS